MIPRFLKSVTRAHDRWELARGRGESFSRALVSGEIPPIKSGTYEAWVRTLPCAVCGRAGPSEVSHLAEAPYKALGSKVPSLWVWPSCRPCHEDYHLRKDTIGTARSWEWIGRTAYQAQVEGVLIVKSATPA